MNSTQSIMELKGIGEKNAALFHKLNIETIEDLLYYFPKDYERFPTITTIDDVLAKSLSKGAILATVSTNPTLQRMKGKSLVKWVARDTDNQPFTVTFFNMPYLKNSIKAGKQYVFYGAVNSKNGSVFMSHPKMFQYAEYVALEENLIPVYPKTKGLSDHIISKFQQLALNELSDNAQEFLPAGIVERMDFMPVKEALKCMHFPKNIEQVSLARSRFAYEEFLWFLMAMKQQSREKKRGQAPEMIETADANRLMEALPYALTDSQNAAFESMKKDMLEGICLNRLLQGDVGSGKTIVAVLLMLLAVSNGYQTSMMAPTEVLARQHFETISEMTEKYKLPFKPVLLVGSNTAKQKREIYAGIADGSYNIILGTHAIIQDKVEFKNLALVITDEQHRFGVKQRESLVNKSNQDIHTVVMSATPIPRSLAIVLYGDMDVTEMKELPSKRLPIKNCVVDQRYRPTAYKFMQSEIDKGHQVYIICPMAEPGVMEELENVVDYAKELRNQFPESVRIAHLHGKMKPKQKTEIMESFASGQIDILVSTTVIEVGINVPNATVMMVENAQRFGLATLHQIRGRVGRGSAQSYCIFMESETRGQVNERLSILNRSNNGFEIANEDLKLRGPGDFMGTMQSGSFQFRFADIYRDADMLKVASMDANEILQNDSLLMEESHIPLRRKLEAYIASGYLDIL